MSEPIRVLVADDHPVVRHGLRTLLELQDDLEPVGEACDGAEAIRLVEETLPDVVLMDLVMPEVDGIEAIRRIRQLGSPLGRIAIIGVSGRGEDEAASRTAGADAFVLKPVSPRALATALLEATHRAAAAT